MLITPPSCKISVEMSLTRNLTPASTAKFYLRVIVGMNLIAHFGALVNADIKREA